jgi:hemoglobin
MAKKYADRGEHAMKTLNTLAVFTLVASFTMIPVGSAWAHRSHHHHSHHGGEIAGAAVVDDLIDRIMENLRLNANPKVEEAHHRVSRAGFKYLLTEMVCWASGGPQQYTGRSMQEAHEELDITEEEWQAFLEDLQACLDKFAVPEAEQSELFAIVESTKGDIVLPADSH